MKNFIKFCTIFMILTTLQVQTIPPLEALARFCEPNYLSHINIPTK
ncbi:hypothetical protein KBB68_03825 [Candidatus Babeliales bacterium]|nr:hypothetical protein [Candidatus Babeliales bacterium]